MSKTFTAPIEDIEAGAYHVASEVLLIGLRHIKEHKMSHPIDTTMKQWLEEVDELIWYLEALAKDEWFLNGDDIARAALAGELLGRRFTDIWC